MHWQVSLPATLLLPIGQEVQLVSPALLYELAGHTAIAIGARMSTREVSARLPLVVAALALDVRSHCRELKSVPTVLKPPRQVHVVAFAALSLLAGHNVHVAWPPMLYVLPWHARSVGDKPRSCEP